MARLISNDLMSCPVFVAAYFDIAIFVVCAGRYYSGCALYAIVCCCIICLSFGIYNEQEKS